jgi:hypothetical protein
MKFQLSAPFFYQEASWKSRVAYVN